MKSSLKASELSLIDPVIERYAGVDGSLITLLQKAQEIYGFLPADVLSYIAVKAEIAPAKVFGVATFYTQFRFERVGRYFIMLCKGTACHVNSADVIERTIFEELGIRDGETSEDGLFTLKSVACLGCCSLSPVMMINEETYGSLTAQKLRDIISSLKKRVKEDNADV